MLLYMNTDRVCGIMNGTIYYKLLQEYLEFNQNKE